MQDLTAHAAPDGDDTARVMDALRSIVRAVRLSGRAVERAIGISGAQLFVLEQLRDAPATSVNELAVRTSTHQSSVSTVVSRLARQGLVARTPAAKDRRRLEISITPRGQELLAAAPETAQSRMVAALQRIPPEHVTELAAALAELVHAMGIADAPASMFFEDDAALDE
jgi:DNA-binding MarR family transcriptional regulator